MLDFLKVKVDETSIICPKCKIEMNKKIYGDIVLDVCKVCGGSWFDKEEVERYVKQREQYNLY